MWSWLLFSTCCKWHQRKLTTNVYTLEPNKNNMYTVGNTTKSAEIKIISKVTVFLVRTYGYIY